MKEFVFDFLKYIPAKILPGVVGLISLPILTRLFSPSEYGLYSLVIATINMLLIILSWQSTSVIRFHHYYHQRNELSTFNKSIYKSLNMSSIFVGTLYLIVVSSLYTLRLISFELLTLQLLGLIIIILTGYFNLFQSYFRITNRVGFFSFFESWKVIMSLLLGVIFVVYFNDKISSLLLGLITTLLITLPIMKIISSQSKTSSKTNKASKDILKEVFAYSLPLVLVNISAWILSLSDRYFLGIFRDYSEVGIYTATYDIAEKTIVLVISLFVMASGPIASKIWEEGDVSKSQFFVAEITKYYIIMCMPAVVGISVLSKLIIEVLLGAQFIEGYIIMPFIAFGAFFLGLQQRYHAGFLYFKKTFAIAKIIGLASTLNIILNFIFIPQFGYIGAAITTFVSYLFLFFAVVFFSRKLFKFPFPWKSFINSLIFSLLMSIPVYYIGYKLPVSSSVGLALSVIAGVCIYTFLLFLFQEIKLKPRKFTLDKR